MKTKEQIEAMIKAIEMELINMNPVYQKKKRVAQDAQRNNLKIQRGVLIWVLADPPAASAAVTMEEEKDGNTNNSK